MLRKLLCTVLLGCVLAAVSSAALADDELRAAIGKFLETGAVPSADNLSAAESQYLQLRGRVPADGRLEYACALVLVNQRKYANALPLLARQVAQHPTDVETGCWYVWTLVQGRRYREALAAMERLGTCVADADRAAEGTRRQAALTLGKIIAYFERVHPSGLSSEEIAAAKNKLLATLPDDLIQVLDEGAVLTATRFDQLLAERKQRLAEQLAAAEADRQQVAEALQLQTEQAAQTEAERDTKAGEASEAARQQSLLQRQIASLSQDRARVTAQLLTVQAMLQSLNRTVDAGTTGTGNMVTTFQNQTIRIDDAARAQQFAMQLAVLNKQAFDMDRKLLEYGKQAQELQKVGEAQGKAADRNEALRQEAQRRAQLLDKRLRQLDRDRRRAGLMTAQMRDLATYLPFDYEGESARVLGWFGSSP